MELGITPEAPIALTKGPKLPILGRTYPSAISKQCAQDMTEENLKEQSTHDRNSNNKSFLPISSNISINISQWNARSVNSIAKINYLRSLPADIIAIQEIWQRQCNVLQAGREIDIIDRSFKRGGGTASICTSPIKVQALQKHSINKDSSAVKIRVNNQYMWLINIYLHQGTTSKIQRLFGKIRKFIPINEWKIICLIGDFNVDINKTTFESDLIKSLSKQLGLIIHSPQEPTRKTSTLDFMIAGSGISIVQQIVIPSPSDHQSINWTIKVSSPQAAKPIIIPNRVLADSLMEQLLTNKQVIDAKSFLEKLSSLRENNENKIMKTLRPKRRRDMELFQKLLNLQDSAAVTETINLHWSRKWHLTEEQRYSQHSGTAYKQLKTILKYHMFQKRDGGIINSILKEDGTITDRQEEIEELLLKTMEEIQVDDKWGWIEKKEFPKLERLNKQDMEIILSSLARNKAIAYDATSDILFDNYSPLCDEGELSNLDKTAIKLRNIWRIDLDLVPNMENTWDARLVPLNKVFPETPTRDQLRPIIIQSTIIKIIESRFASKLHNYLDNKLDRSQTGFVRKLGIQVNLARALQRITMRTSQKKNVYGLFIDFSQAYNSVPHVLLFQKLRAKKVLEEDEISYLEQLYARYTIRFGKSRLRSNKGVAQGSVISPALFDIFIEDLSDELRNKADLNIEDLLFYADDVLILCTSTYQVEKCIQILEDWSLKNGMKLNKNKSGIVVFANRKATRIPKMKLQASFAQKGDADWIPSQKTIKGVPLCKSYKYLGTHLTPKLSSGPQIGYIKKKAAHLFSKLYPYLANASADARRDMWQTMVAPLFNAALALLYFEPSTTHKNNLERLRRCTFKQFLMISTRTNTELINDMIRKNFQTMAENTVEICQEQWEQRKEYAQISACFPKRKLKNGLRGVPNSWCTLVNTQAKPCVKCKKPGVVTNSWHLKYHHNKELSHINTIWRKVICPITEQEEEKELRDGTKIRRLLKRSKIKEMVEPLILNHLSNYRRAMAEILSKDE